MECTQLFIENMCVHARYLKKVKTTAFGEEKKHNTTRITENNNGFGKNNGAGTRKNLWG